MYARTRKLDYQRNISFVTSLSRLICNIQDVNLSSTLIDIHDLLSSVPPTSAPQSAQSQFVPEMAAPPVRTDDDTWALAFKMAQQRESKLMLAYEEYLFSLQGDNATSGDISNPEFITSIVEKTIEDGEKKRWRVSLFGADIEVGVQVERLTKFLLWSQSIVRDAMSSQPYAALAWSGASLLLPVCSLDPHLLCSCLP